MPKPITMSDVAKLAGVSQTTVSLILNNHKLAGRISTDTRRRVLKVVRETGYRPSQSARQLAGGKGSGLIGFICGNIQAPGNAKINHYLHLELKQHGYRLLSMPTEWVFSEEMEALNLLFDRSVDGVILYSRCLQDDSPIRRKILNEGFPLITYQEQQPEFTSVQSDYSSAYRQALQDAAALGHRRIVFIGQKIASELHYHLRNVCAGFHFTVEEHLFETAPDLEEIPELDQCLHTITFPALLVIESSDMLNFVLRFFLQQHRSPLKTASLLAINPTPQQQQLLPELSVIQVNFQEQAKITALNICNAIRGERTISHDLVQALYLPGSSLAFC